MELNIILGLAILCILFLLYTSYETTQELENANNSKTTLVDDYNKKINLLENNLAEINLKIASLNNSNSNTNYSESVLTKYKEDIEGNIKDILLQLNSLVPKDIYDRENQRINLLLEQYKSTNGLNSINSDFVDKYTKEVKNIVDKISDIENKWTKLESDMVVELNGKISVSKLNELKQEIVSIVSEITSDNVKKEAVDIISKSIENINSEVKTTTDIANNTIISLDKLIENNKSNSKELETFKQDIYNKLINYGDELKISKDEILKLKTELTKSINEYVEINTSKTKNIEDKLAAEISANTTAFLEIRNSLKNVMTVIGDVDNLKYTPILKNNIIDALYDLNSRLSSLEVKSKDIDMLKSSVNVLLNSINKQPTGFWDYHYVTNSVAYTMNEIKKKLDNCENKDNPFYLDILSKYKSVVNKFNYVYVNISNGGKSIIQLTIMQGVDEIKYLVDKIFYTNTSDNPIKMSQEEYSLYNKEIDRAKKEIEITQKELVTADYINNIQLSVNRLHSKSFINDQDVIKLKSDLESLNISTTIKNDSLLKSLEELKTSVSKLTISDNKINELDVVIKGLQSNALQYYYTTNTVKAMEQTVQSLNNWVGGREEYFGDDNLIIYIKKMDENIKKNKENDDIINLSLNKLKKLVGEFTLESNTSVGDIAMKARDDAARVKAVIGLYDWNKNNGKSVSESLDNIAAKIINIESTLGNLNPTFIASQTSKLLDTTTYLMNSFTKLTQEDKDIRTIIASLSADNSHINNYYFDLFKNTIGIPKRSETVYAILDKIEAELKVLKDKVTQPETTLAGIINMENKYTDGLNYTIAVNNYVTEVEKKVLESKVLIDTLSNDLKNLKNDVEKQNSRLTNYEKLQANVDLLNSTIGKVEADLEWRYTIHCLEQVSKNRLYMINYVPLEKYNFIDSKIQSVIDNIKLISLQTYARSNEKFYSEYTKFNEMITDIYNNHIIKLTLESFGSKGMYDVFWEECGGKIGSYVNVVNYDNKIDTRWNEPLWYYTQRKFTSVYNDIQNMITKFASKIDLDTLVGRTNTIESNVNSSLNKIKEFDTKFTTVDKSLFDMDEKINKLSIGTVSSNTQAGVYDIFNVSSTDITIPPVIIDSTYNKTNSVYFTCGFTLTNGTVSDGTIWNSTYNNGHNGHLQNSEVFGLPLSTPVHTPVKFLDLYNLILAGPSNMILYSNKFTYYSPNSRPIVNMTRSTDNNSFVAHLLMNGIYHKIPVGSISTMPVLNTGTTTTVTITGILEAINNDPIAPTINKKEILTIINSLIEFSKTTNSTFSIYMCVSYNILNAKTLLAAGSTIKGSNSRIYLDTTKSIVNNTPTIVTDSLLDVSSKGLLLNGAVMPDTNLNYDNTAINARVPTVNMCPTNSYVCGVSFQYGTNNMRVDPKCCNFNK